MDTRRKVSGSLDNRCFEALFNRLLAAKYDVEVTTRMEHGTGSVEIVVALFGPTFDTVHKTLFEVPACEANIITLFITHFHITYNWLPVAKRRILLSILLLDGGLFSWGSGQVVTAGKSRKEGGWDDFRAGIEIPVDKRMESDTISYRAMTIL